jgi:crotonobetainyl-CoA:carnitine CoA-transferase CaiB-like acyl-CoA transferase
MGTYRARDGLVNIAASSARMWRGFCEALGAQALLGHPDYQDGASRLAHSQQLDADINRITAQFDVADLVARLNPANVPCGPIHDIGEAFEDAQVKHLRMTRPATHPVMGEIDLVRSPINLSGFDHPDHFPDAKLYLSIGLFGFEEGAYHIVRFNSVSAIPSGA